MSRRQYRFFRGRGKWFNQKVFSIGGGHSAGDVIHPQSIIHYERSSGHRPDSYQEGHQNSNDRLA
jgi:hypothetical protein